MGRMDIMKSVICEGFIEIISSAQSSNLHKVNGLQAQPEYIKVRIHEWTTERN